MPNYHTDLQPVPTCRPATPLPPFFILRTPVLPLSAIGVDTDLGCLTQAVANAITPSDAESFIENDRERTLTRLRELASRQVVGEAIRVASPIFWHAIEQTGIGSDDAPIGHRHLTLNRYITRMAARPTPFGLFAGYSIGHVAETCSLDLTDTRWRRVTRLDPRLIAEMHRLLLADPLLQPLLTLRPNNSLHQVRDLWRYAQRVSASETGTCLVIDAVDSPQLSAAIDAASNGATADTIIAALLRTVPETDEATRIEAEAYLHELIASGILESAFDLPVTGPEPFTAFGDAIGRLGGAEPLFKSISAIIQLLSVADAQPGTSVAPYADLAEQVRALIPTDHAVFQVQLIRDAQPTLTPAVMAEVYRGVEILHACSRGVDDDEQQRIVERFVNRFGDREVPLVEALDPDVGIEFGPSLRTRSGMSKRLGLSRSEPTPRPRFSAREEAILDLMREAGALTSGRFELSAERIQRINSPTTRRPLPNSFSVLASIAAPSAADISDGRFAVLVKSFIGPSGARLLGRFCHSDERLEQYVRDLLRTEETLEPDAIFAEIVHLPASDVAAVVCRPALREYEIPYLGISGAPLQKQLPIVDLSVSIRDGRFWLRSRRLNKRIIPRLTSAHNYLLSENLPLYRFLCWLQDHDVRSTATWDWGALDCLDHLPRVSSGRCVLSREQWTVTRREIELWPARIDARNFLDIQRWRERRGLPRHVLVVEGDRELLVDFENVLSIETFLQTVRDSPRGILFEAYPGIADLCVRDNDGGLVNELVIPFVIGKRTAKDESARQVDSHAAIVEQGAQGVGLAFIPGSDWLFAKLYTGRELVDELVTDYVQPLVTNAISSGFAKHWHFVRYEDPNWHLRIRFHGDPKLLTSAVSPMLHDIAALAMSRGLIWHYQLDTYVRETARYGGPKAIAIAEQVFWADSEAAVCALSSIRASRDEDLRLLVALYSIDRLMTDFGLNMMQKLSYTRARRSELDGWLRVDIRAKRRLGDNYRRLRDSIAASIAEDQSRHSPVSDCLGAFARRSAQLAESVARLKCGEANGQLTATVNALLPDFVHMSLNRLWPYPSLGDELAVHDLLFRHYEYASKRRKRE